MDLSYQEIAIVGDDINDKEVMEKVGLAVCPSDAVDAIKGISDIILEKRGVDGFFREFVDRFFTLEQ